MTEKPAPETAAKGEFARLIGVTPGRVSQYIREGKLHGPALAGEGRGQRVVIETAKAQLRQKLDISQSLGNGLKTRLDAAAATEQVDQAVEAQTASAAPPPASRSDEIREKLEEEKLHDAQFRRRKREEEELERRGIYMRTTDARAQMVKVAGRTLSYVEGGLADIAGAFAAKFEIPARDALHLLRAELRKIRAAASDAARREARNHPGHVADDADEGEDQDAA